MKNQNVANVLEKFADLVGTLADELREAGQDDGADVAVAGREVEDRGPRKAAGVSATEMVQVSRGDLWRLVNRARKMIRLARQGKVPNQDDRAPLCRSIKTLKAQGLVRKPYDLRD